MSLTRASTSVIMIMVKEKEGKKNVDSHLLRVLIRNGPDDKFIYMYTTYIFFFFFCAMYSCSFIIVIFVPVPLVVYLGARLYIRDLIRLSMDPRKEGGKRFTPSNQIKTIHVIRTHCVKRFD